MKQKIITNQITEDFKSVIEKISEKSDYIKIAVAFFTENDTIKKWREIDKKFDLLVSLRPPTNYYALKSLQTQKNVKSYFLDNHFHSKIYLFYKNGILFSAIIGSSNFTDNGLTNNIETNIVVTEDYLLIQIEKQFDEILDKSYLLQPSDLDKYKPIFENYIQRDNKNKKEQNELQKRILERRQKRFKKQKINKEARQYFAFWKIVDEVKNYVEEISNNEFPNIPIYLTIDHFWHWVKVIWAKENHPTPNKNNREKIIQKLFKEYCAWDKSGENYTKQINQKSINLFSKLLSEKNIDKLTEKQAEEIYSNLHSGSMRSRRFKAHAKFANDNDIKQIRNSLKYLLYSNDELDLKIHNLCYNPVYKLKEFKSSATQEIIGWVNPISFPLRNDKADDAIKLLGYEITDYE